MRECIDCARPLNDGAIECDWCAMRAEIRRLNDEMRRLRSIIWDLPGSPRRRLSAVRPLTNHEEKGR